MNEKKERIVYFDVLRVLAILAVVILHVAGANWSLVELDTLQWRMFNIYDSIVRWCVPVFVMISGALFLRRNKVIKELYKKNILRIVTSLIFWSAIYAIYAHFACKCTLKEMIRLLFIGHYHMWFLYMILGLYIVSPVLKKLIEDKTITKYFLVIAFILAVCIPQAIEVITIFFPYVGNIMQEIVNNMHLDLVLGYTIYFVIGYYINTYELDKKTKIAVFILGICSFIATAVLTQMISFYTESGNVLFYKNNTVNVFFESIFIFLLVKEILKKITLNKYILIIIRELSKYSFGIYLVHALILEVMDMYFKVNSLRFNPIISVPIVACIVFVISLAISAALNHIPIVKKYIV